MVELEGELGSRTQSLEDQVLERLCCRISAGRGWRSWICKVFFFPAPGVQGKDARFVLSPRKVERFLLSFVKGDSHENESFYFFCAVDDDLPSRCTGRVV